MKVSTLCYLIDELIEANIKLKLLDCLTENNVIEDYLLNLRRNQMIENINSLKYNIFVEFGLDNNLRTLQSLKDLKMKDIYKKYIDKE